MQTVMRRSKKSSRRIVEAIMVLVLVAGGGAGYVYLSNRPVAGSATATPTPQPTGLTGTIIYQEDENTIKKYDVATNVATILTTGAYPVLSADHSKVSLVQTENGANTLGIYDLATQKTTTLMPLDQVDSHADWSPDGTYLLVDGGTSPERGLHVVTLAGKEIANITYSGSYFWLSTTQLVFNQVTNIWRDGTSGHLSSLAILDVATGKTTILKKADTLTSYQVLATESGRIAYEKSTVRAIQNWTDETKVATTDWSTDATGQTDVASTTIVSAADQLAAKVFALLPETYQRPKFYSVSNAVLNPVTNQVVFTFNQNVYDLTTLQSTKSEQDIATVNLNSKGSFTVLFKGAHPGWIE